MEKNNNNRPSTEQNPPRPRQNGALVKPENTTNTGERDSIILNEESPSNRVDTSTPLQGKESVVTPSSVHVQNTKTEGNNTTENTETTESVAAQYVVCKGAMCSCDGNPSIIATLEVTSHKKYYVNDNGNDKLIATINDTTFKEGAFPFITCIHKKGNDKTCTYAPQGQWKVPNNRKFPEVGGKDILTEKGLLKCTIGGKIELITHGQTATVDSEDVKEAEESFADICQINSLLSYQEMGEVQKYPKEYVSDVSKLECVVDDEVIMEPLNENNTRAFYVLKDQLVEFKATATTDRNNTENRRGDNISWGFTELLAEDVLSDAKKAKSEKQKLSVTNQSKVSYREFKRATNQFGFVFTKCGKYIIDAASRKKVVGKDWFYVGYLYCYIEVLDKASITELSVGTMGQDILIGNEVAITVKSNLSLPTEELNHLTIEVVNIPLEGEESTLYIYRHSSIESISGSMRYIQTKNKLEAKLKCVNSGSFKIRIMHYGQELTKLTKQIKVLQNKVIGIERLKGRLRKGTKISFKAKLQNNDNIDETKVKWRLITPRGTTYAEEKVGTTSEFKFDEIGKYKVQCIYGNGIFSSNKTIEEPVEVIENKIENISVNNAIIKEKGKKFNAYINNTVTVSIGTQLGYTFEPITSVLTSGNTIFYKSKEAAEARVRNSKSAKDPLLLYSIYYMVKGANQTKGAIKIGNSTSKEISITPIYFIANTAELNLTLVKEGIYFLSVQLGSYDPVNIILNSVKGEIKQWTFVEESDSNKVRLGFYQDFKILLEIEGAANMTAKLHFWEGRKNIDLHNYDEFYSQEIKFNEQGKCELTFKGEKSELWKKFTESISILNLSFMFKRGIYFTITGLDTIIGNIDNKIYKQKNAKHIFPKNIIKDQSVAEISHEIIYEGYFANDNGRKEVRITEYGKKVPIILRLYNGFHEIAKTEDYTLELYENKKGSDRLVKSLKLPKQSSSTLIRLELDTSEPDYNKDSHERDMKSIRNPRMFYFILMKKNRIVYIYPFNYGTGKANDGILSVLFQEELDTKSVNYYTSSEKKEIISLGKELIGLNIKLKYINLDDFRNSGHYSRVKEQFNNSWEKLSKLINKKVNLTDEEKEKIRKKNDTLLEKAGNKYLDQLKLALHAPFNAIIDRKVPVKVESAPSQAMPELVNHDKCPNCIAPITVEELKQIYWTAVYVENNKNYIVNTPDEKLQIIADTYNTYMKDLGMDTCHNKAYFFACVLVESGFRLSDDIVESMKYTTAKALKNTFKKFNKNPAIAEDLYLKSSDSEDEKKRKQIAIAEFVYGGQYGNKETDFGWYYRGRGLIQLTFKDNYEKQSSKVKELVRKERGINIDIVTEYEKVSKELWLATLTAMAYFTENTKISRMTSYSPIDTAIKAIGNNPKGTMKNREGKDLDNHKLKKNLYQENSEFIDKNNDKHFAPGTGELFKVKECTYMAELRVDVNIITYHIYYHGAIYKKYPNNYVEEDYDKDVKKVHYIYYAEDGSIHPIGTYEWIVIDEMEHHSKLENIKSESDVPEGYKDTYEYPEDIKIDGKTAYFYYDNKVPSKLKHIIVLNKKESTYSTRKYVATGGKSKVIKIDPIDYKNGTVSFKYVFYETARYYCGLDQYAVFLGGLANVGKELKGTGFGGFDGTGFPSVGHVNGYSMDINYGKETQELINELAKFGCKVFLIGNDYKNSFITPPGARVKPAAGHNSHLHCGPIDKESLNKIIKIIKIEK